MPVPQPQALGPIRYLDDEKKESSLYNLDGNYDPIGINQDTYKINQK